MSDISISTNLTVAKAEKDCMEDDDDSVFVTPPLVKAREEFSLTPPLPAPPSPLQYSDNDVKNQPQKIQQPQQNSIGPVHLKDIPNVQTNCAAGKTSSGTIAFSGGLRMKSRPKRKGLIMSPPSTPPPDEERTSGIRLDDKQNQHNIIANKCSSTDQTKMTTDDLTTAESKSKYPAPPCPFTWDLYLELASAEPAPKEAFNQPKVYPKNNFQIGMKLEMRDPRVSSAWGLASVVSIDGLFLRLRFDCTDKSNDVYELIDSDRIRPVGSVGEALLAPVNFTGNIAKYAKFVDKTLQDAKTVIATSECFPPRPPEPTRNLFKVGMKLEAVDVKNPYLVCPATIGLVEGSTIKIVFDGWRGSFDYKCDYRSREIFPVNWCYETFHSPVITPPGWDSFIKSGGSVGDLAPKNLQSQSQSSNSSKSQSHSKKSTNPKVAAVKPHYSTNSHKIDASFLTSKTKKRGKVQKVSSKNPTKSVSKSSSKSSMGEKLNSSHREQSSTISCDILTSPRLSNEPQQEDISSHADRSPSMTPPGFSSNHIIVNKYQCQRTISYHDWKKAKELDQMPRDDSLEHNSNKTETLQSELGTASSTGHSFKESTSSNMSSLNITSSFRDDQPWSQESNKKHKSDPTSKTDNDKISEFLQWKPESINDWSVQDIIDLISTDEGLVRYSSIFIENEIDGRAFILLNEDTMLKHMGFKIGPCLKIADLIKRVKVLM